MSEARGKPTAKKFEVGVAYYSEQSDTIWLCVDSDKDGLLLTPTQTKKIRENTEKLIPLLEEPVEAIMEEWGVDLEFMDRITEEYIRPKDYRDHTKRQLNWEPARSVDEEALVFFAERLHQVALSSTDPFLEDEERTWRI